MSSSRRRVSGFIDFNTYYNEEKFKLAMTKYCRHFTELYGSKDKIDQGGSISVISVTKIQ